MNMKPLWIGASVLTASLMLALPSHQAAAQDFSVCQVTDVGGIDDKGFNETAWKGAQDASSQLNIKARYLESQAETDYAPNIGSFIQEGCGIIITVGFLLGDATEKAAKANPNTMFSIVDYAYNPTIPNVLGQVFATDQGAFLAGYLAAGVSKTGVVGTFGGINIPPVTAFMDGFVWGVAHYNKIKGTNVKVLGWNPDSKEGLFTNNFESLDDGRSFAQNLMDEGADIVLPVAGPVGLGSAALADEVGTDKLKIIGVDADQYLTDPEKQHVYLTSVLKRMDITVFKAVESAKNGTFEGGLVVGTLANGGIGLAPLHSFEGKVSASLMSEVEALKQGIISGSINVGG